MYSSYEGQLPVTAWTKKGVMDLPIHFAKTKDDVSIAYWMCGEGVPVVHMPWLPWSHIQLEWANPEMNRWYSAIAEHGALIRYDGRGTGLSERDVEDVSIDAHIHDIEAVVDALGLEKFFLVSVFNSGPIALHYAARHPEQLLGLALWSTYPSGAEYLASPQVAAIRNLVENWELYTETGAHAFVGWSEGDAAHRLAALMREAVTHQTALRLLQVYMQTDARDVLSGIRTPTLVMHPRSLPLIDVALARRIAAAVPGAQFYAVEGVSLAPTMGNISSIMDALSAFLRVHEDELPQTLAVLEDGARSNGATSAHSLTAREIEILRLVVQGQSGREIAEALVLSPRTVERHIANIYAKAKVNNRAQITTFAMTNKLI